MKEKNSDPNCEESPPKSNSCIAEKQQEYLERYKFWSSNSIQQLSFSNNLLLTIAIAALGYFFEKRTKIYTKLYFEINADIDWVIVFFLFGSTLMALSIISGGILSISRLYDFRLTRHISMVRKMVCQKAGVILKDEEFDKPSRMSAFLDLVRVFFGFNKFVICRNDCMTIDETFKNNFKELRKISFSLGRSTWSMFNLQFLFFIGGIIFYTIVIVFM